MWILHGDNSCKTNNFASFKTFWENAFQIAVFTAIPECQHRYGMAATNYDASAHSLTDAVSNFGMPYATTQELLGLNVANILAIQGQLQMLCQAVSTGLPPQQQPRCPRGGHGCGQQRHGHNSGGNSGGNGESGGHNVGGGGYNGGGSGSNVNSGGYIGGGGGSGSGYGGGYGGGNGGHQTLSSLPPLLVKWYENWNYCSTHGGNVDNNHTSATCACPSKNHQHAATHTNAIGGNMHYMNKTVLPSATGRHAVPTRPPPLPLNYTPTFSSPMDTNGPQYPTLPDSWGFGPHTQAYQQANNIPPPNPALQ